MARKVEGPIWLLVLLVLACGGIGLLGGLATGSAAGAALAGILGALVGYMVWFFDLLVPPKDA